LPPAEPSGRRNSSMRELYGLRFGHFIGSNTFILNCPFKPNSWIITIIYIEIDIEREREREMA
jgi:hypothetical protein